MWEGTSAPVARSLSVRVNVCWGAEALFPGQGKQIVGPFANEKKSEWEEKESRKWRKVLSLTGRLGLHTHDFQFNSEEVQGINRRKEIESVHVGKKNSRLAKRSATQQTADAVQDVVQDVDWEQVLRIR